MLVVVSAAFMNCKKNKYPEIGFYYGGVVNNLPLYPGYGYGGMVDSLREDKEVKFVFVYEAPSGIKQIELLIDSCDVETNEDRFHNNKGRMVELANSCNVEVIRKFDKDKSHKIELTVKLEKNKKTTIYTYLVDREGLFSEYLYRGVPAGE